MKSGSSEETRKQQSKGGRPKKVNKRSSVTGVRLSEAEYEIVQEKAKTVRLKLTVYIQQMAVSGKVKPSLSEEQMQLIRQLAGMANNLNQLTKKSHQEGILSAVNYLLDLGGKIKSVIQKLEKE